MRLFELAFGGACGFLAGFLTLVLSVWNAATGFGEALIQLFISVHPTVFTRAETVGFVLVNTVYALIDGFLLGLALAFLYNFLSRKQRKAVPPAGI